MAQRSEGGCGGKVVPDGLGTRMEEVGASERWYWPGPCPAVSMLECCAESTVSGLQCDAGGASGRMSVRKAGDWRHSIEDNGVEGCSSGWEVPMREP